MVVGIVSMSKETSVRFMSLPPRTHCHQWGTMVCLIITVFMTIYLVREN